MKQAEHAYLELTDAFDYALSSWLNLPLPQKTVHEAHQIIGASCFLLDNIYCKQDAGREISLAIAKDIGADFNPAEAKDEAAQIRVFISGGDFALGQSPLRDYVRFVSKTEPSILNCYADSAGKLVAITCDELTNLVYGQTQEIHPTRLAEIIFLVITEEFGRLYREILGKGFFLLQSVPYFLGIEKAMERIRKENCD